MDESSLLTFVDKHLATIIILMLSLSFASFLLSIYFLIFRRKHLKKMEQDHFGQVAMNLNVFESNIGRFVQNSLKSIDEATEQLEKIATDGVDSMAFQFKKGKSSFTDSFKEINGELKEMHYTMEELNRAILSVSEENKQLHSNLKEKEERIIKQNYRIEQFRKKLQSKSKQES